MRFRSLIETTLGVLTVNTLTVPHILTTLTFGLVRKVVCKTGGSALKRYQTIRDEAAQRLGQEPPVDYVRLREIHVFYAIAPRVKFWHRHTVEYMQAQGEVLSYYHFAMQWLAAVQKAIDVGDFDRFRRLLEEEERRSKREWRQWRKFRPRD